MAGYLGRLGTPAAPEPDLDGLRRLHAAHVERIPFENLSIHLGEPISLDVVALAAKVVDRGRGGFCYELNGLFAELLLALGYGVERLGARVWSGERWSLPLDHLALRVHVPGLDGSWLADVGFGAHSRHPLRADDPAEQVDPDGTFVVSPSADGDLEVSKDGVRQCRIEPRPRELRDFVGMCWWHQTSPESHFTGTVVCSRSTADGRISLSGDRLIRTVGGERTEEHLAGADAVLQAYLDHFGIRLDRVPRPPS